MAKNILVFYSNKNSHGRKDATGAFIPEAKAFAKVHDVPEENVVGLNLVRVTRAVRKRKVLERIYSHQGKLDAIAFFGHGWPSGIQFGFRKGDISPLVKALKFAGNRHLRVLLYACWAAENQVVDKKHNEVGPGTDGGFADLLRDEMVRHGLDLGWVDAHKTAGHTTWNPYVVRFHGRTVEDVERGGEGGSWIVSPKSPYWKKWRNRLTSDRSFRYEFPFVEEIEILYLLEKEKMKTIVFNDDEV